MKNVLFILTIIFIGLISCEEKEKIEVNNYPKEVTHIYNGESVTYNVIKKDYDKDLNGNSLSTPITKLWLDRNLGAERVAIVKNDSMASGDLFQWGRLEDGHQIRNSDTTHSLSTSIIPNHNKFIIKTLSQDHKYDWLFESNDSLWNDEQNTNCPCPDGWRIPTRDELLMEMHSWDSYNMNGAYSSELKWVSGGSRSNHGTVMYSEYWAFIWASTPDILSESFLLAIVGDTSEIISAPRMYGLSIRCIKDY